MGWSTEPAHEPLIPKWMWNELATQRQARARRETDTQPRELAQRVYLFRSRVFCGCGRRMFGNHHRSGNTYYMCWPRGNNRGRCGGCSTLERHALLAAELARLDDDTAKQRDAERRRLQRVISDLERRQGAVLRQAQDADLDDPFTKGYARPPTTWKPRRPPPRRP